MGQGLTGAKNGSEIPKVETTEGLMVRAGRNLTETDRKVQRQSEH